MIMFFLPWGTYVLIGTVAFTCSFAAVWLAGIAFYRETPEDDGPYPCGAHLGTDADGAENWCWQMAGHDGDHLGMCQEWPDPVQLRNEWPDDDFDVTTFSDGEDVVLPQLPQRLSKVPFQAEHNDPWPTCDFAGCERSKGHFGKHYS